MGGLQASDWQPKEVCQGRGALRGSSQDLNYSQVLLLAVGVSACVRDIVQVFPEESNKIKSSSTVLLVFIGIDLKGRQISGQKPPIMAFYLFVKSQGGRSIGKRDE